MSSRGSSALRALGVAMALAGTAPGVAAQEALSLREAIERAAAESEDVAAARARAAQASAQARAARARLRPQIGSLLSYQRTFRSIFDALEGTTVPGEPFVPDTTLPLAERVRRIETAIASGQTGPGAGFTFPGGLEATPFGQENVWIAALTLDQSLFSGGTLQARLEAAEREAAAARHLLADAEGAVALEVKEAYYETALGDALVAIARASLRQAEEQIEVARARFRDGAGSELDLLRAQVERDNLFPELVDALDARERARLRLLGLVDLPLYAEPALTTGLCPPAEAGGRPDGLPPPGEVPESSLERPSVRAAEERMRARDAETRAARGAYLPTIGLFGNLGWQAFPERPVPDTDDWLEDWYAGVEVRLPIYQGGARSAEIQLARARHAEAEQELEREREAVRIEYRQAHGEVVRAWEEVLTRRGTQERAERIYTLNRLRYEEGVAIPLEVLDARLALQRARTHLVRSYHDYFAALARAEYALGTPLAAMTLPSGACPAPGEPR